MQAGLASRPLTFRKIFTWASRAFLFVLVLLDARVHHGRMSSLGLAA